MTIERCQHCKNYLNGLSCLAFDRIPDVILNGKNDHSKPIPGQDGFFIYEPNTPTQ